MRQLSYEDLATLNAQLLELVEARMPLPKGLSACAADLRGDRLKGVLDAIKGDLESGKTLSDAMAARGDALPPIYRSIVAAGEATGDLGASLQLLVQQAEVDGEIDTRMREALAYPLVSLGVALAVTLGLCYFVIPEYEHIYAAMNVELPRLTELVLACGGFVRGNAAVTVVAVVVMGLGLPLVLSSAGPRVGRALLYRKTPERALGEMSRALSGFLGKGVPAPNALRALSEAYGASFPAGALANVQGRLEAGATLGDALRAESCFPPTFTWLIASAEENGTLPSTLADLAHRYERQFKRRLKVFELLVGPLALIFVGGGVACVVLAAFLPIFKLSAALLQ